MAGNIIINMYLIFLMFGLISGQESSTTSSGPCGENEIFQECPRACGKNCSDVYTLDNCMEMCWQEPRCECISGYAYSSTLKKCVRIEDCPCREIVCPPNQRYTKCKTTNPCKPGCVCKKGFKLDAPTGQCYSGSALCPDPHSYWDSCANACFHRTCKTIDDPIWCAFVFRCTGDCVCQDPYIYDENSKTCVTEECCRNPSSPK